MRLNWAQIEHALEPRLVLCPLFGPGANCVELSIFGPLVSGWRRLGGIFRLAERSTGQIDTREGRLAHCDRDASTKLEANGKQTDLAAPRERTTDCWRVQMGQVEREMCHFAHIQSNARAQKHVHLPAAAANLRVATRVPAPSTRAQAARSCEAPLEAMGIPSMARRSCEFARCQIGTKYFCPSSLWRSHF